MLKLDKMDHVGLAVRDLQAGIERFKLLFGAAPEDCVEVPADKVKTAFFRVGDVGVELLQPISSDSPVEKFLHKRGEGVHHLCFSVKDIRAKLKELHQAGIALIDHEPRRGAHGDWVAFIHPKAMGGVLVELVEKK